MSLEKKDGQSGTTMDPGLYRTIHEKSEAISREKELKTSKYRKWIREEIISKRSSSGSYPPGGREFDPPLRNKINPATLRDFCYVYRVRFIFFIV